MHLHWGAGYPHDLHSNSWLLLTQVKLKWVRVRVKLKWNVITMQSRRGTGRRLWLIHRMLTSKMMRG